MNWILIMVVTALYPQGGTRSVDVTTERFATKQECVYVGEKAFELVERHKRAYMDTKYECINLNL